MTAATASRMVVCATHGSLDGDRLEPATGNPSKSFELAQRFPSSIFAFRVNTRDRVARVESAGLMRILRLVIRRRHEITAKQQEDARRKKRTEEPRCSFDAKGSAG